MKLCILISLILGISISLFLSSRQEFAYEGDDYSYGKFGKIAAEYWHRTGKFPFEQRVLKEDNALGEIYRTELYHYYCATIYYIFGKHGTRALLIMNAIFRTLIIFPVIAICRRLKIKRKTFIYSLFLFWPSVFYWSLFNLKEPLSLLAALMIFYFLICTKGLKRIAGVIAFTLLFLHLHTVLLSAMQSPDFVDTISVGPAQYKAAKTKLPFYSIDPRTGHAFSTAPFYKKMFYVLIHPFVLSPSLKFMVTNVESVMWWIALIWVFRGMSNKTAIFTNAFFVILVVFALAEGSMGTLLRHKAILYYVGFILLGKGLRI